MQVWLETVPQLPPCWEATGILGGELEQHPEPYFLENKNLRGCGRSTSQQPSAPDPFFLNKNCKLQNHVNF